MADRSGRRHARGRSAGRRDNPPACWRSRAARRGSPGAAVVSHPTSAGSSRAAPPCRGARGREDIPLRAALHEFPRIHHHDAVGDLGHHAHIVGDEDDGRAVIAPELLDQAQDLGLDRDVERRGRLVGDQERRVAGERHGDHGTLAHAARELMRVAVDLRRGIGHAHLGEQFDGPGAGLPARQLHMGADLLLDLPADRVDRRHGAHRILEDHGDLVAADMPQRCPREADELLALVADRARQDGVRVVDQSHDGERGERLAGARLADHGQDLALGHDEGDVLDRLEDAGLGAERDAEIVDLEQRLRRGPIKHERASRAGRAPHRGGRPPHWRLRRRTKRT